MADCDLDEAEMDMNLSKLWEIVKDREACMLPSMGSQRVRHDLVTEQHSVFVSLLSIICKCITRSKPP